MITIRTTFILGAGASAPYGFPIGKTLTERVCKPEFYPTPDGDFASSDNEARAVVREFGALLAASGQLSIDAFLERRQDQLKLGKRILAHALIEHEIESRLLNFADEGWYRYLLNQMFVDCATPVDFAKNRVSFITFNYDRSLEHCMTMAVAANYGLSRIEAWATVSTIPIIHVYGLLGAYCPEGRSGRQYINEPTVEAVGRAVAELNILHEGKTDSETLRAARTILGRAERIIALGFGFHPTNVSRLHLETAEYATVRGTALGLKNAETKAIKQRIGRRIDLFDLSCLGLLREHVQLAK